VFDFVGIRKTAEQIRKERETRSALEAELAKLPPLDTAKFKKLQKLETDRSNAESALNAMAARVEVICSDAPVKAGEKTLASGEDHVVSEDTELRIGKTARLRVKPGGGTSLSEAREDVSQSRVKLQDALDKLGLTTLEAAAEALANRERIQGQVRDLDTRLSTLRADSIEDEVSAAQLTLNNAQGEVDRRKGQYPEFAAPADLTEARKLASVLGAALVEKESSERRLKGVRDESAGASKKADEEAEACRTAVDKENREVENLAIELGVLTRTHGEDEARSRELARLLEEKGKAETRLSTTRAALDTLQPDLLNADKARLERAITQARQDKEDAGNKLAVAKHTLSSDGTADPAASLATAEAQLKSARGHLMNEQRRARAVQLLHDLFLDEQRKLSEQITRPLVEKVSGYVQCLFGARAQAAISLEQNQFSGLRIARPGREVSACQFDQLSGGTREQAAAAFRLAMAEVLAESHDGCLPLIFDDAFAYSDPERVQTLQRMLDLAANRGLQIIVLTCNPIDYAALGAKQISLPAVVPPTGPLVAPAPQTGIDAENQTAVASGPQNLEELCDKLVSRLKQLGGSKGNISLRQSLGWDETTYESVREALIQQGRLAAGRGKGGSVSLIGDEYSQTGAS
jgi:hypothetical protein